MKLRAVFLLAVMPFQAFAAGEHVHTSPYLGQEQRDIKSLSTQDIADLTEGRGWGFAKTAELNGVPGPSHVLEMKDALDLTAGQRAAIENVFKRMKAAAAGEGRTLINGEAGLEAALRKNAIDADTLMSRIRQIEASRGNLRYIHLEAHLQVAKILTAAQRVRYAALRGYGR